MPAPRPLCFPTHWPVWILITFPTKEKKIKKLVCPWRQIRKRLQEPETERLRRAWKWSLTHPTDPFRCFLVSTELWQLAALPIRTSSLQSNGSESQIPPAETQLLLCRSHWCCREERQSSGSPVFTAHSLYWMIRLRCLSTGTTHCNRDIFFNQFWWLKAHSPWGRECLCQCAQRQVAGGQPGHGPNARAHFHNLQSSLSQMAALGQSGECVLRWGFPKSCTNGREDIYFYI